MEQGATTAGTQPSAADDRPPRKPSDELPTDAPRAIREAADGPVEEADPRDRKQPGKVTAVEESEALQWLIDAGGTPMEYTVPVRWDTKDGMKQIAWRIQSMPGGRIDEIENANRQGDGPFAPINQIRAAAAIVAEATRSPDIHSEQFRRPTEATPSNPDRLPDADPVDALLRVFQFQSGLLVGLAENVRAISGWSADRVGQADRVLTRAAGNS